MKILNDCKSKTIYIHKKNIYSLDCVNNKYTIIMIDGDHRNILIRGSKSQAKDKISEILKKC